MSDFSCRWEYEGNGFVPVPNPFYKYVVHKTNKLYQRYCKSLLLFEKPGCYLSNVGQGFDSYESELKDFVENSEFCPTMVKEDFKESQKEHKKKDKSTKKPPPGTEFFENGSDDDFPEDPDIVAQMLNDDDLYVPEQVVQGETDFDAPLDDNQVVCNLGKRARDRDEVAQDPEYEHVDGGDDYDCKEFIAAAQKCQWNDLDEVMALKPDFNLREATTWLDQKRDYYKLPEVVMDHINIESLNFKQGIAYDLLTQWMWRKHIDPATNQFFFNLCGAAGCGKSYLLNAISQFSTEKKISRMMEKAAPTANAAFLIGGTTLHGLLHIPVPIVRGKAVPELSTTQLRELQEKLGDLQVLFIDEKSMIGLEIFHYIDARLRQIKANDKPFGGVSIVLMGDNGQLPPVGDKPLFANAKKSMNTNQSKGAILYSYFKSVVILDDIVRQQGDDEKEFRDVLTRLRNGKFDEKDWEWLKSQDLLAMTKERQQDFKDNATMICACNDDLKAYNIYRIKALKQPIAPVKSVNKGEPAKKAKASAAGGLPLRIIMAKGAKMVITRNLWKEAGLVNGAHCTVRYIVYAKGRKPPELPDLVLVHCPQYRGPSFFDHEPNIVPIVPVNHRWFSNKQDCMRTMIPLIPGYAISIHKAQGGSFDMTILNLWLKEFCNNLTYTAISRCRKLANMALQPFPDLERFLAFQKSESFLERLREDARALRLQKATLKRGHL